MISLKLLSLLLLASLVVEGSAKKLRRPWQDRPPLYSFCNIGADQLGFINTETEKLILVPYCDIDNWPDAYCNVDEPPSGYTQHTAIDSWKFIYISTVSNGINTAASVIAVTYESIDWDGGSVDGLKVLNVYPYADITTPSEFEGIFETDSKQPIVPWLSPSFAAVHGPTFRPGDNKSVFWGTWTNYDLITVDTKKTLTTAEYLPATQNSHGYFFSPDGSKAISARYWFDAISVGVFEFKKGSNVPYDVAEVFLENDDNDGTYGATTHYAFWVNNRYAYVATMQLASTSISVQKGYTVGGPGVYLIDSKEKKATRVAGTSQNKNQPGVWNSGSDVIIANNKLYVCEEETMNGKLSEGTSRGSVGVWQIEEDLTLKWIKRIVQGSGDDMPEGFSVGHGGVRVVANGKEYVYVASYASNQIIVIDTDSDTVVKVWDEEDDMSAPHGGFVAGGNR